MCVCVCVCVCVFVRSDRASKEKEKTASRGAQTPLEDQRCGLLFAASCSNARRISTADSNPLCALQVLECHAFICKSEQAAMALVHSCTHAYEHKEGWTDDAPPVDAIPK